MTRTDTHIARAKPDRSAAVAAMLFVWFGGFVAFMLVSRRAPQVERSDTAITISGSGYARTVNYADLDSVTLRMNLDGLDRRLNALQNGNDYRGMFEMRPYGRTAIYVDASIRPFVVLHTRRGVTIFSAADSMTAIELATDLQRVAGGRKDVR